MRPHEARNVMASKLIRSQGPTGLLGPAGPAGPAQTVLATWTVAVPAGVSAGAPTVTSTCTVDPTVNKYDSDIIESGRPAGPVIPTITPLLTTGPWQCSANSSKRSHVERER